MYSVYHKVLKFVPNIRKKTVLMVPVFCIFGPSVQPFGQKFGPLFKNLVLWFSIYLVLQIRPTGQFKKYMIVFCILLG